MAEASDEMFCESCLLPARQLDPMHAECKKVSLQEGNCLVQQREDATVCSENQPKIVGDRACEGHEKDIEKMQATIRGLQAKVNKAADEMIDKVNKQREILNERIEKNYSADIEKLQRRCEEIRKKMKKIEVFIPDRSEKLVVRINRLKAAEVEMNEFKLPKLEPLEAEELVFERNILTLENFSLGELMQPLLAAEDLPVFSSPVCCNFQIFLHPVLEGFPVTEEFRQAADLDICRSRLANVNWAWVEWKARSSWSALLPDQSEQLEVNSHRVELTFGGRRCWREQLTRIVGDFIVCVVGSPSSDSLWLKGPEAASEIEKLIREINKFNSFNSLM